jgi:hypothetical protein
MGSCCSEDCFLVCLQLLFLFPIVLVTCNLCILVVPVGCGLKNLACNASSGLYPWVALLAVELGSCCRRCGLEVCPLGWNYFLFFFFCCCKLVAVSLMKIDGGFWPKKIQNIIQISKIVQIFNPFKFKIVQKTKNQKKTPKPVNQWERKPSGTTKKKEENKNPKDPELTDRGPYSSARGPGSVEEKRATYNERACAYNSRPVLHKGTDHSLWGKYRAAYN